jgi:drug/metabolite transporter (DMT)-like permease
MKPLDTRFNVGAVFALLAALLFGASTPFSKVLLRGVDPIMLAGLLYLGSGIGLAIVLSIRRFIDRELSREASMTRADIPWLAGSIFSGGIVAPVLLMFGLRIIPASSSSLLLNLEGVLTAMLAWFVFKENFDFHIALGFTAISAGGLLISWEGRPEAGAPVGALLVTGACLGWAIDNNLTRRVSANDPLQVAASKGLIAGAANLIIALASGAKLPGTGALSGAALIGFVGYGISLALFVLALRHVGTARTGAYFSVAPFIGAAMSILVLHDPVTVYFLAAAGLMGIGVWLHLTERHKHEHLHTEISHEHAHIHDEHHTHEHGQPVPAGVSHSHPHRHAGVLHSHPHYPDIHHRHEH